MVRFIFIFLILSSQVVLAQGNIKQFRDRIDSLVLNAIDSAAFPGAQVLIMHNDSMLVNKAYGFHTYNKERPVLISHLYDLASLTKVMGGGLSLMKLQGQDLFHPSELLGDTHPYFKRSEKSHISWQEILAHQSGLEPYIVFWSTAMRKNGKYKWRTFGNKATRKRSIRIDQNLFLHRRYPRKMRKLIRGSKVRTEKKYLYSGLGFLLIPDLVKERSGKTLDNFLRDEVFKPLGLDRIAFQPSNYFPLNEIIPTERDTFFRKKLVHGYVHDENASMLNGVSANAGLFANATSLNTIAQEILNNHNQVFKPEIVNQYSAVQFSSNGNRRGLAFDKPLLAGDGGGTYIAASASPSSYGHSGFTGTFIWIDPDHNLTVIFLSNRVYPYRSNRKLYSMDFRPKLHQAAYDYILRK